MEQLPFVSIIMPVRNESGFIAEAVEAVLDNDYPAGKVEVIVVDGDSSDNTADIVREIAARDGRVRLMHNPRRIVPHAMNMGIRESKGEVFVRVDGHVVVARDFLRNSVRALAEHPEAWVVGGYIETVARSYIGEAIAAAMQSPVGVGNSRFRLGDYEGWVDTLAFGTHYRWVPEKIGYFDEELVRNQDDEFNLRIILGGGKIWLSRSIRSRYFARGSLRKLWRQYFQYGFWRVRTLQKHGRPATVRQLVPLGFVGSIVLLAAAGFLLPIFHWALAAELIVYLAGLAAGTVGVARKSGWKVAPAAPAVFLILHFAYGLGSIWGLFRFLAFRGWMPRPADTGLSR